jgi:zinc/manganese transport system substrate-binding protein
MEMITVTVFVFNSLAARRRFLSGEYTVMRTRSCVLAVALPLAAALLASACSSSSSAAGGSSPAAAVSTAKIAAIGARNEYADVIAQVGGKYVQATASTGQVVRRPGPS